MWASSPPQGEAPAFVLASDCGTCRGWGLWPWSDWVWPGLARLLCCGPSLLCLLCRSRSDSFQVVFRGSCSLCSCAFGVFVGGGAFQLLVRRHLEPELDNSLSSLPTTARVTFRIRSQSGRAPAQYLISASLNNGAKRWVFLSGRQVSQQLPLHSKLLKKKNSLFYRPCYCK